ncbi:CPBP family intramembrane glutamic endopeptidase [Flavobacterium chuncheonense]|uniref:CPBP family intramembrane glutamic endopeptidase n=1 Tax=Flavobacterium chuncheonense TaxID=2026653 RepID=A0ABW5YKW0_9FLAO
MNKEITRILLLLTIPFIGLLLKKLLLFFGLNEENLNDDLISKILIRSALTGIVLFLIFKWGYGTFLKQYKNTLITTIILVPLVYISIQHVQDEINNAILSVSLFENILYCMSTFSVGVYEELLFRVLAFSLVFSYFNNKKENLFKSVILTSFLFGIVHFINLFKITSYSVIIQVIFAIGIGLILQSLLLRFKNIFIVITLHALINYWGMYQSYFSFPESVSDVEGNSSFSSSLIWSILIFGGFFLPISYLILKPVIRNAPQFSIESIDKA